MNPAGDVTVQVDRKVPMRDGIHLSTDIYHPAGMGSHGESQVPTVLFARHITMDQPRAFVSPAL